MALSPGQRLGPYTIVAPLGEGGMGEVYRARDDRLDRTVAIKVLPPGLAEDRDFRDRFRREARAASAISHPNIAHVYDVGEDGGHHFIAMEFVEGSTLREQLRRGPLPARRILDIGAQVASALEEAHAKGVIHRDIKSANVVVTDRDQAKVLDFGLARRERSGGQAGDTQASTEAHTQIGVVMGTVPYMSPEQALGTPVDARTDVFSLGVVLYEMATGQLPFGNDSSISTINNIINAEPESVSHLNRHVPLELERIIRKCLEKDRDRRYASAGEARIDLENLRRDMAPGAAAPRVPGTAKVTRPGHGRQYGLIGGALAVVVAIAAGLFYMQASAGGPIDSIAVLPFVNESEQTDVEFLSDGMTESLINTLAKLPNLKVISRTSAFAFKGSDEDFHDIAKKLGVRAVLMGRLVQRGGQLTISAELVDVSDDRQLWGNRFDRSLDDLLDIERELTRVIAEKLRLELSGQDVAKLAHHGTEDPEAYQLYLKGKHFNEGTAADMLKGQQAYEEAVARDPGFARAHAALAEMHMLNALHGTADAAESFDAARASVERALELDPNQPEALVVAGNLELLLNWDWRAAEEKFNRATKIAPANSNVWLEYAWVLWPVGEYDRAMQASQRALDLDPLSRSAMHHVGFTQLAARRYDEAIESFKKAIEVHPKWVWGYTKMGIAYAYNGMPREALAAAERAEELIAEGGETHLLRSWLGVLYARSGEEAKAREALGRLAEMAKERAPDPTNFADVHAALGEEDAALTWLEKGLRDHEPWMPFVPELLFYDDMKSNPRFQAIVEKLNLRGEKRPAA